jgi:outer membrane protein
MKRLHTLRTHFALIFALTIASAGCLIAQMPGINSPLPDAPTAPPILFAQQTSAPMTQIAAQAPSTGPDSAAAGENPRLALSDAEKLAIKNNPRVSVARLLALAQHQVMRETRSAELLLCQIVCPPIRDLANNLHAGFISSVQPRFSPN